MKTGISATRPRSGFPGRAPRRVGVVAAAVAALTVSATPRQRSLTFERVISPFPVADAAGRDHPLPFLGGFDVPRPQFVDIDGDGDLDLFVQEYSNALVFFENTGAAGGRPRYEWRTDRYQQLDIGEWYRFVDVDADGRIDLVSELPFSHIRHFRNTGTAAAARFEYVGPLRDSNGDELFLDRQNIPAFVDLDCDRRLDLFIGRVEGTVARYEAEQPGGDRFSLVSERFEDIEIIGRIGVNGANGTARHGANALAFGDFDADRDLDLFWGDFFEPGLLLIENVGATCSTPSFQVDPVLLPYAGSTLTSGYNAPAPVDLDHDGDLDFVMGVLGGAFNPVRTSADNFYYWERTGAKRLELRTTRFLDGLDFGSETVPAIGDIDADGDLDMVVGNKIDPEQADAGRLAILLNEGSRQAPRLRIVETLRLADDYHLAPALGDIDSDGDLDLLLGTWNQGVLVFRNAAGPGRPRWIQDQAAAIRPPRTSFATPALGDVDGDGDLDLLVGQATGVIAFYRNDGTRKSPRFVLASERLDDIRVGRRSAPAVADIDGDGRPDLVVGREAGGMVVYRNTGSRAGAIFAELTGIAVPLPALSAPQLADLNGDGVLDLVSGTASGGMLFYRGK